MRVALLVATTAALVATAACNRAEEAPPSPAPENRADVTGNSATGAPADVTTVMHDRHENYEDMGEAMKGIGDELKGAAPSVDVIRRHAAVIAGFAPQIPSWFPAGSGPETGRRTRAKAEIWTDPETFRQRAESFAAEAARFNQTAQSGDLTAVRAGMPALGKSCKDCHDRFRGPELDDHEGGH